MVRNHPEIEIWHNHAPINISKVKISIKPNFKINVGKLNPSLEDKVDWKWYEWQSKHKEAKNNDTTFLLDYDYDGNKININTHKNKFKYVQTLAKNPFFKDSMNFATTLKMLALSSHCTVVSNDNEIVLGVKKNLGNRISGFCGYTSQEYFKNNSVDVNSQIRDSLKKEFGNIKEYITSINHTGLTLRDKGFC